MKILQVLFSGLGGHGSVAFSLVRGDRERKHQHAMVFYGIEPLAPGYAQTCADLGVGLDVVYKRPGLDLGSMRAVIRALERAAPDAVILHSTSLVAAATLYARSTGCPLVVVDHLSNQVKLRRDWNFVALALALADRTVFLTPTFATEVKSHWGRLYSDRRIQVIGNGIDVTAFAPAVGARGQASQATDRAIRIGMHGRFSASKDHVTLVKAIARLRASEDGTRRPPVHLVLAGAGETLTATKQLTAQLNVTDRVEFLDLLPEDALPAYLHSLDVFVQSSHGETMSTAVMQAMAAALPVVASDVPGLRNMVQEGETGRFFPVGDETALSQLVEDLASNPAERARLGARAMAHAGATWSHETMFRSYESLLLSLRETRARHEAAGGATKAVRLSRIFRSRY
jgi:glycosyltransferase involved in cell wall biosynthesis